MPRLARYGSRRAGAGLCGAVLAAVALTGVAQIAPPSRGGLLVSSTLERIAPKAADDGDAALDTGAAAVASHADELVLSVEFTNTSEQVVDAVRITSPVPAGVRYVADSASGPGSEALFSVDEGRTFGRPDELTIVGADGVARAADAAEYTHVRFVLDAPLDAGALGIARFRAVPR
ncbi:MAG TPA: hypothetical protein VKA43_14155 [Gammaproteobacteria bacterium]|nr:hypothetical protein [Gammaproteobacteria bacterium]